MCVSFLKILKLIAVLLSIDANYLTCTINMESKTKIINNRYEVNQTLICKIN